ncbi:hypothetical protein F4819DRAFT_481593 [Hypoxylon fuscum]|nr:hypothetical protein F4819DRAFT_481593 [Hypoxylon fuscum]
MVGRRRRALSNSTVATIDQSVIQFYKEESILKGAPTRAHTDDWPCFELTDATVYHRDGTLANLLHVDLEGPFIVRGRLQIEKDQERFLVNRHMKNRSPWIQIQNTQSFSIGLKDDQPPMPVLWASGGAGWFEIVPSDAYKYICDTMFQGVCLHYAVLDEYEAALEMLHTKKKNKSKTLNDVKLPLDTILFKYAVTVGDGITLPEARLRLRHQAIFLLSHFPKGTEFYQLLTSLFPDIVQKLAAKDANGSKKTAASKLNTLVAVPYPQIEKSSSLEVTEGKKKGRPPLRNSASRSVRNSENTGPEAVELSSDEPSRRSKSTKAKGKSPMNPQPELVPSPDVAMLDAPADKQLSSDVALASGSLRREHSSVHPSIETDIPQLAPQDAGYNTKIDSGVNTSLSIVLETLHDIRQELLKSMHERKQKKHPDDIGPKTWCTKLYLELSIKNPKSLTEVCEYFASDLVRLLGPEWQNSEFYKWLNDNVNTNPKLEFITEADMQNIVRRKKKQKPHEETRATIESNEFSAKPAGKKPRGRGTVGGLRPSTGSKKRLRHEVDYEGDDMDLDEDGVPNNSKRSRHSIENDDDEALGTDSSSSDDEEAEDKGEPLTRVVIRAEELPSTTPKGPSQTWTCEEPDCGYVVRAANEEEGQALINEHFEAHEQDAQEEAEQDALNQSKSRIMELALLESQRGHLPINHLLEKIRRMGDKTQRREEVQLNGQALPKPIKRNLLV